MNRILNRVQQKFHEEFVYQTTEIKQNRLTTRWANEQPLSFSLFLSPSPPLPNRSNTQDTNFPIESSPERFQFSCTNSRPAWNEEADCFFLFFSPNVAIRMGRKKREDKRERERERFDDPGCWTSSKGPRIRLPNAAPALFTCVPR